MEIFQAELIKMFVCYNKPIIKTNFEMKLSSIMLKLRGLDHNKISLFFEHVTDNMNHMPSDGELKQHLRNNVQRFGNVVPESHQIESNGAIYPDNEWRKQFTLEVQKVVSGFITPDQAKVNLGLVNQENYVL